MSVYTPTWGGKRVQECWNVVVREFRNRMGIFGFEVANRVSKLSGKYRVFSGALASLAWVVHLWYDQIRVVKDKGLAKLSKKGFKIGEE